MSMAFPENLIEVKEKVAFLNSQNKKTSEKEVIENAILEVFQIYLDDAEEGHYDTAKLISKDKIQIIDVMGRKVDEFFSKKSNFVDDFKNNSLKLYGSLKSKANEGCSFRLNVMNLLSIK